MADVFQTILTTSFHGSIVILAVLLLRLVLRKAPKKFICLLWMLAGIRLLLPVPIESAYSLQPQSIQISIPDGVMAVLPIIWIALAAGIGLYSIGSYIHLRRQVFDAVKIPGGWESDRIETAFVLGFIKPKIYIPTGMSRETQRQILAHERTHLDKGDHWIKMIGFLALAFHWFNPLVWVSYILLCKDIEMACDERVVQFMELEERKAYSSALLRCSTNRAHYAACPVAFGEISVRYRIKSILNYRKPSFWLSLLAILAFVFVAVCLMTSPQRTVEVPVDADVPLREISQQDPAELTPVVLPELEPNPDWGVDVIMDATSPTGGKIVYVVEERFAAASESITMRDGILERWNGTAWEAVPSKSGQTHIFEKFGIGFAQSRERDVNYFQEDLDWTLSYGALPAGDYRICQTIESVSDSATFRTAFHIYREELPSDEKAALERCETALAALVEGDPYSILLSETAPDGKVYPVKQITKTQGSARIDHYLGDYCVSSNNSEEAFFYGTTLWDAPFHVNQNRQFLFPEGQSVISQEEISFCSAWEDYKGISYRGNDTFRFNEDGTLNFIERLVQTLDGSGNVTAEHIRRMETVSTEEIGSYSSYISAVGSYQVQDSFDATNESPWNIFFRVDDDLLAPGSGEIWLATNAVGVSNYTTDGKYWLEKKVGKSWQRLGDENNEASWGEETIKLVSQTTVRQVDWTADYGELDAGVYRMGKHFYNGSESIIQYAEFAIYQTGGIHGAGGEEALARVDAAIEKLQTTNYRVEQYGSSYSAYGDGFYLSDVIWKYGTTMVNDYYNDVGNYSHSSVDEPGDTFYGRWLERTHFPSEYDSIYFPAGYSVISDQEIRFAFSHSQNALDNPCRLFTYRFDDAGNITEILEEQRDGLWGGYITHYIVTDTPEEEIRSWVEAKKAER
ncbi:MAG: M56 family metallopeptidase [Oscillospiraceae bacterium]|nr:M56 family metallopeptidase [Oscillospiraceae bacterium]